MKDELKVSMKQMLEKRLSAGTKSHFIPEWDFPDS